MSKFTFIHEDEKGNKITHEFDEISLPEILKHFEYFLKGCTFHFDGSVEIVIDRHFVSEDRE